EHATRMLQARIAPGEAALIHVEVPGLPVVGLGGLIVATEQTFLEPETFGHDQAGIGVFTYIFLGVQLVLDQIVDQPTEEHDIRAGTKPGVIIRHCSGAVEAWVDGYQDRVIALLGPHDPAEANRRAVGRVAAHGQDDIRIGDVGPVVRHGTATKCWGKTCHRWSVSNARLVVQLENAQCSGDFLREIGRFVGTGRSGHHRGRQPAVDQPALLVMGLEILVAVILHVPCDTGQRLVPADALPIVGERLAHLGVLDPRFALDEVQHAGTARAQRATADRMIRVAFDVENFINDVDRLVTTRIEQHAATHRAVGTDGARHARGTELEMTDGSDGFIRGKTHHGHARRADTGGTELEELATGYSHGHGYLPCSYGWQAN